MQEYKIITFGLFDAHKHGNILEKFFQFRYQGFVIEEKYDFTVYNDAEFDQYDNPFTKYIAIMKGEEIVACARLNRTDIPYMAKDFWSHLISKQFLPSNQHAYEVTRVYTNSKLPVRQRSIIARSIVVATYVYALTNNIHTLCYVTHPALYNSTQRLGMDIKSVARLNLPNFPNLHFVHVNVNNNDAQNVAKNLLDVTGFDIIQHFPATEFQL